MHKVLALAAALAIAFGLGACDGGARRRAVIHVGSSVITATAFNQRLTRIAPAHVPLDPPRFKRCIAHFEAQSPGSIVGAAAEECRQLYESLQQRVLGSLITEQWLIGEAREHGLALPDAEASTKTRKAESELRQALRRGEPPITHDEIASYYEENLAKFGRPQQRYIDIVERIPTKSAARVSLDAVRRRGDMHAVALHEVFTAESLSRVVQSKRAILKSIFTAKPHTLIGPLPLNEKWCFFEVTRVIPADVKPLAQVQSEIEQTLSAEREQRKLVAFIAAWRKKWIARTHCSAGYVIQKCSEYRGPKTPEDPTSFS